MKRLFAIGDVHGCFKALRELVEEEIRLQHSDRVVLLGDYIDRGPQSREVIDYILRLQGEGYDLIPLMGNHEDMLLAARNDDLYLWQWLMNGGGTTLDSFGIRNVEELEEVYLQFFINLPLYHRENPYIFVHAGFNDEATDPFQERHHMLWEKRDVYYHPFFQDKVVVHGHRPVSIEACRAQLVVHPKVIGVDTGCVYFRAPGYGRLSAVELYSMELYTVKGRPES